ncbi:hypothetical protein F7649_10565 [Tenacibaculum piscium]|uniref:hypothetical protein n=1 Tax=Tenacibaculum piscium TaxID=1458515 RepID=UPI00187B4A88|nr:hypothetical protein [Tenacibaculum piscium]MBE7671554.1 hypothetical protein [Tenacibaculum piscium]
MRKAILSFLQIKSIKNASSLATDGKGNVIAGKKSDDKEIDLAMYRKKRRIIFINNSDVDSDGEYSLLDANLEDTLLIVQGESTLNKIKFNSNSIKSVGSTIEIVNALQLSNEPIDIVFNSKAMNNQDENSQKIPRGKALKVTKIMYENMQDYLLH